MFLYLVRHGEAMKGVEDAARGLTDKGMREVSLVAAYARDRHITVGAIYHSGKKRALQTSTIFSEHLKPGKGIFETDGLAPMDEPEKWVKRIAGTVEDIMLIGHLPYLSRFAGLLLCGDKENMHLDFKTGGVACLQRFDDGRWVLEWMIMPEMVSTS
jgi:phosphohistidine phosphatase